MVGNAAYNSAQLNAALTPSFQKSAMIDWLADCDIPFSD
jgi:hypothetical protein